MFGGEVGEGPVGSGRNGVPGERGADLPPGLTVVAAGAGAAGPAAPSADAAVRVMRMIMAPSGVKISAGRTQYIRCIQAPLDVRTSSRISVRTGRFPNTVWISTASVPRISSLWGTLAGLCALADCC